MCMLLSAADLFFCHFWLRSKQGGGGYITMHVWIQVKLRCGARGI